MKNIIGILFLLVNLFSTAQASDCMPLGDDGGRNATIDKAGSYCFIRDIILKGRWDIHSGGMRYSSAPTIGIRNKKSDGNIIIDLNGYVAENESRSGYAILSSYEQKNIFIKNGSVQTVKGMDATAILLGLAEGVIKYTSDEKNNLVKEICVCNEKFANIIRGNLKIVESDNYGNSSNKIDNLKIESAGRALKMGGSNNVISNNIIKVYGHTAIYIYGPNTLIEGNTFIVEGKGDMENFDAPIKLRDAKNSIIRNNKIIYKNFFGKHEPAAINLIDSEDVDISGNVIEGFDQIVRVGGQTSYSDTNNRLNGK